MNDIKERKESELQSRAQTENTIVPVCAISGDETTVVLRVELPGVHKDDITVRIDNDQLIITGKQTQFNGQGEWLLHERRQGNYERIFTIDSTIDRDKIDAVYELGVMTLTLHVKEEVKPRRIEISAK